MELEKKYNPKNLEERIYQIWIDNNCFDANPNNNKKPFTIIMPPPNVTGKLHMGHALDISIQDAIIRYKRMKGYEALWQPGTDHAAISTEIKVTEQLKSEGIDKYSLGREGFLKKAWEWKKKYENNIINQQKRIGASCDWKKLRFTMDDGCSEAVLYAFKKLYDKGLIYKGDKIVNWCPKCKTSISDAEVIYEEQQSFLYYIRYYFENDNNNYIVVATTRPETMFGDTAVCVNPDDDRYKNIIGKKLVLPIVGRVIPIIADSYVDKDFGTGLVKITPSHDPNDYEVGLRHNLECINVITDEGKIYLPNTKYHGLDRFEARKQIITDLKNNNNIEKIEDYVHNVGIHDKCGCVVEPLIKSQWFVKMKPLAQPAIEALEKKELSFIPDNYKNTYLHWLNNIKDWCISRQLWWGHRIPVFYCKDCGHLTVSNQKVDCCEKCKSKNIYQDNDTLDTWFSSALWPFSTLGWPKDTKEYEYFYPTDVLVTAYDIIFFWVIRMVFSGIEHTKKCPFKDVLIHGIVRDELGRKMSKSLGNGIDPLDVVEKYGADALRISLLIGNAPGNDMRYFDEKVEASRNFLNKVWNATRFIIMSNEKNVEIDINKIDLELEDKWILTSLNKLILEITNNIDKYEFGIALSKIQKFIWEEFCDWYIELVKYRLYSEDKNIKIKIYSVLKYVLLTSIKMLHPFAPFITEEIYEFFNSNSLLIKQPYPEYDKNKIFNQEYDNMIFIQEIIRSIRNRRIELNVPNSKKTNLIFLAENDIIFNVLESAKMHLKNFGSADNIEIYIKDKNFVLKNDINNYIQLVFNQCVLYIPLDELIDKEKEIERLKNELLKNQFELDRATNLISNKNFVSKAPKEKIDEEKEKIDKYSLIIKELEQKISVLSI